MKKFHCFLFLFLLIALACAPLYAVPSWQRMADGIREVNVLSIAVDPKNPETLFAGTTNSIYKTINGGKLWETSLLVRGTWTSVNHILIHPKDPNIIIAATQNGLYMSRDGGGKWDIAFRGLGTFQRNVLHVASDPGNPDIIYAACVQGMFKSKDGGATWLNASPGLANLLCRWVEVNPVNPNIVYVPTNQGVFRTADSGETWNKIYNVSEDDISFDELDPDQLFENEEELDILGKIRSITIDPLHPERLFLACFNGVFFSRDEGRTWSEMTEIGLSSRDVRMVAVPASNSDRPIFASGQKGAFMYSQKENLWEELYDGITSRDFYYLSIDEQKPRTLWAASKDGVYKLEFDQKVAMTETAEAPSVQKKDTSEEEKILKNFDNEPTILEVQQVAIKYAEVSPEKIDNWRKEAKARYWLPDVSIGTGRDINKTIDVKGSSSNPFYVIGPDDETRTTDYSVTWELSSLIWNTDQTSIDTRSRLMVQLRGDVLDEVTKTYFERRRLQVEMLTDPPGNVSASLKKELRLQELTAQIDSLTGGWFSQEITRRKSGNIKEGGH
ncbi:MAG: hypothetical protein M1269_05665 [Chloroflexi bacterium]|nr:hypothetical protein [Chloroflexota bacterium]